MSPKIKFATKSQILRQHPATTLEYPFTLKLIVRPFLVNSLFSLSGKMNIQIPFTVVALLQTQIFLLIYHGIWDPDTRISSLARQKSSKKLIKLTWIFLFFRCTAEQMYEHWVKYLGVQDCKATEYYHKNCRSLGCCHLHCYGIWKSNVRLHE